SIRTVLNTAPQLKRRPSAEGYRRSKAPLSSLLYFRAGIIPRLPRICVGAATTCEVDFMRNALNLSADHNAAIRAEIGERLRVLLSKEQPGPSPRIQHLLHRLRILDATGGRS